MEKKKIQRESNEQLNLFMFGFDSVSRLAAERKLPKTMNYIRNKLKGSLNPFMLLSNMDISG
jgi:hypothetical protein